MLLKALVGTAKDLWQRRLLPAQVRAKDTRLAFAEIIVRPAVWYLPLPTNTKSYAIDIKVVWFMCCGCVSTG